MTLTKKTAGHAGGFTLVELLVVLAILGVLIGLLIPAVQSVRAAARRTACSNKLRQIAMATINFDAAHRHFPAGVAGRSTPPYPSVSWLTQILPFAEQTAVWDQAEADYRESSSPFHGNHRGLQTPVSLFHCPSDPAVAGQHWTHQNRIVASTNYLGVNGTNYRLRDGVFYTDSDTSASEISDGLSQTLMIGERPPSPDYWYGWWYAEHSRSGSGSPNVLLGVAEINDAQPGDGSYLESCPPGPYEFGPGKPDDQCSTLHYWSYHGGGAQFGLADGSIHFIPYLIDPKILNALATRAGREPETSLD